LHSQACGALIRWSFHDLSPAPGPLVHNNAFPLQIRYRSDHRICAPTQFTDQLTDTRHRALEFAFANLLAEVGGQLADDGLLNKRLHELKLLQFSNGCKTKRISLQMLDAV